jgi:hypothetical protein
MDDHLSPPLRGFEGGHADDDAEADLAPLHPLEQNFTSMRTARPFGSSRMGARA